MINSTCAAALDTVIFIESDQPAIHRGWDTASVAEELERLGFRTETMRIEARQSLEALAGGDAVLFWPASYTVGPDVDGLLVTKVLQDLGVPFVGSSAPALALNSKLTLKERLAGSPFATPAYQRVLL
jgi:hypothetical protein